jgi:hypothetical protein
MVCAAHMNAAGATSSAEGPPLPESCARSWLTKERVEVTTPPMAIPLTTPCMFSCNSGACACTSRDDQRPITKGSTVAIILLAKCRAPRMLCRLGTCLLPTLSCACCPQAALNKCRCGTYPDVARAEDGGQLQRASLQQRCAPAHEPDGWQRELCHEDAVDLCAQGLQAGGPHRLSERLTLGATSFSCHHGSHRTSLGEHCAHF